MQFNFLSVQPLFMCASKGLTLFIMPLSDFVGIFKSLFISSSLFFPLTWVLDTENKIYWSLNNKKINK